MLRTLLVALLLTGCATIPISERDACDRKCQSKGDVMVGLVCYNPYGEDTLCDKHACLCACPCMAAGTCDVCPFP
jgi:hypothetical protein